MKSIESILSQDTFSKEDIIYLLSTNIEDRNKLYAKAAEIKEKYLAEKFTSEV